MAALTIHIDDSGTHAQSPIAVAAGWIASASEWNKFIRQWESEKKQFAFDTFHHGRCYDQRGENSIPQMEPAEED